MAHFSVKVTSIKIEPHPNADNIELAVIGGFRSIVQKGKFKDGDLVAYIPEQSIVPNSILAELGLEGKLSGLGKNRVKAIKLRGELSQGLVYPAKSNWIEGQDVTEELGIVKWEPAIPTHLAGQVDTLSKFQHLLDNKTAEHIPDLAFKYDIENIKNWMNVLEVGEEVVMTEKLHGTLVCIGVVFPDMKEFVSSKGLLARGFLLQDNDTNKNNVYIQAKTLANLANRLSADMFTEPTIMYVFGEIFGKGIQDLDYQIQHPTFALFDIAIRNKNGTRFLGEEEFREMCFRIDLPMVPLVYQGGFSHELLTQHTVGNSIYTNMQIREGVVIKPVIEREDKKLGRVILKSINPDYLTRGGNATEYN